MSALQGSPYEKKNENIDIVSYNELFYGSMVMDAVILCIAAYFITISRWRRFEWTIISCMFIKYALY